MMGFGATYSIVQASFLLTARTRRLGLIEEALGVQAADSLQEAFANIARLPML